MNFSFNINSSTPKSTVKNEIDKFKLRIDKDEMYLSNFEIFEDDNHFLSYVDDYEIAINYDNDNKITSVECYNDDEINVSIKYHIDKSKSISENLISLNIYFYILYQQKKVNAEEDEEDEEEDKSDEDKDADKNIKKILSQPVSQPVTRRSRLSKLQEAIIESEIDSGMGTGSESESDSDSLIERIFDRDEEEYTKESKPIKFEANLDNKSLIIDLTDNIIMLDNSDEDKPSKLIQTTENEESNPFDFI
jgi:hypothetical protein